MFVRFGRFSWFDRFDRFGQFDESGRFGRFDRFGRLGWLVGLVGLVFSGSSELSGLSHCRVPLFDQLSLAILVALMFCLVTSIVSVFLV